MLGESESLFESTGMMILSGEKIGDVHEIVTFRDVHEAWRMAPQLNTLCCPSEFNGASRA